MLQHIITAALEKKYQLKVFSEAIPAITSIEKETPDLILLDISLPDMNGIEVLQEIKRLYPGILIIMITATKDIQTAISAMKLGAYDYMVKPINVAELEVAFETPLRRSG